MSIKYTYMLNVKKHHITFGMSNNKPQDPVVILPFFNERLVIHITEEIRKELTLFNVSYKILYAWDSDIHVDHIVLRSSSLRKPSMVECYLKLVVYE